MAKKITYCLGVALLILIAILLINSFRLKPWPVKQANAKQPPLPDSAIQHLSAAVQIQTVSFGDITTIDSAAFTTFGSFIERSYPLISQQLSKTMIKTLSCIFEWKGKDSSLLPIILMGHYDVVPVEPASLNQWKARPFSGAIMDSCIWGRGSVDDKCGVISILEAVESLLHKNYRPQRNIYLCFGHDEEIGGQGAAAIVNYLKQKKVQAEIVLDEGGEITREKIKEVDRPVAVIGVAEKGYASFELRVQKEGGHSSIPPKETAIDILVSALYKLRNKSIPAKLTPAVDEFIHRIGPSSNSFLNRMAAGNMWLLKGIIKNQLSNFPEGNALIHTTIVPTIIESGIKDNVIPGIAKAIVNTRIITGESSFTVENFIRETIHDERVQIKKMDQFPSEPSAATNMTSPAFKMVENAVYQTIPDVLPTPYLMLGATDSRYYRQISDGVLNFLPTTDSKGFHGVNERLPIQDFRRSVNFIRNLIIESNASSTIK